MVNLIVAFSENYVIGKNNELIWKLPQDLMRFKKLTLNHTIVMGRKTFQSLPGILPFRNHVVISKKFNFFGSHVRTENCLKTAIHNLKINFSNKKIFIIGGGQIYCQSMCFVDQMYITKIHIKLDGDTFFPFFKKKNWKLIFSKFYKKNLLHEYDFTFLTYKKIND